MIQNRKSTSVFITSSVYALSIAVCCLVWWFYPLSFSIPKGSIPLIGQASKENVLVGARVTTFYELVFLGTFLWIGLTWLFNRFYKTYIKSFKYYSTGLYFSIPIIPVAYFLSTGVKAEPILLLLVGIFFIFLIRTAFIHLVYFSKSINPVSFELSLGISFFLHILIHFFFGHLEWIQKNPVLMLLSNISVVQVLSIIFWRLLKKQDAKKLLLIISGIPFLIFFSIELYLLSLEKQWTIIGFKKLYIGLQLLWIIVSWLIIKTRQIQKHFVVQHFFIVGLIFGFSLLLFYKPIISFNEEFFEIANPANAVMRVLRFGEVPMLDFMSSHMLSEQWYGILYQTVFGVSNQVDFTIYNFFNFFIYSLLVYWILVRAGLNKIGAIIFIFFFPVLQEVFYSYTCFVFLVLFSIQQILNKSTTKNIFLFFLLLFVLTLWRIDIGVAAIFSTIIFLPLYWWLSQKQIPYFAFLKGVGLFLIFIFLLFLASVLLRSWNYISENFLAALHYIKGSQSHGYAELFNGSYHQFYVFHVLFVVLAIVLTVVAIYIIKNERLIVDARKNNWLIFSVFSFVVFIANAQRGLVRHGFAEQDEIVYLSTFYLGIIFFIMYFIRNKNLQLRFSVFFLSIFFSFSVTKYFSFFPEKLDAVSILKPEAFKQLNVDLAPENYHGRVLQNSAFKERVYGNIKSYLDKSLTANETFLDFSNTPMLYYYCERKVPGYFNQILQNTIDDYLQKKLLKDFNNYKIPIVIYSAYPPNWFDATDGILNTVRHYRIAEYIFENYRPIGVLNKYSIWGLKEKKWEEISVKDSIINQPINLELGYLAGWEGNKYIDDNKGTKNYFTLTEKTLQIYGKDSIQKIEIGKECLTKNQVSILLKTHADSRAWSTEKNAVIIFKDSSGKEVHRASFVRDDNQFLNYAIRLSNHYFWHQNNSLTIEFPNFEGIEKVLLIKEQ